ncbi:PGL/p-HBAD biosynthesis glycosyltransferase Rv2957/MT3031 [Oligella urethralis]|uniref:glycosyltransferase family 2 protein n=1 Tax=Oligella urethralis TaxID=90245 RepID=UPI000C99E257|nr:glycosyltransferase family A protein [Oligella urethralis]AVL70490.1 glycosyltransferase family 2 protein [Oligella urethralis]PMC16386.1 glycosyl transferase [Oligella urethralis]SUA54344.1 PGL/p-HBAD biosynthesis glycosyltransferase Rv2957/MT3031 [Oligella urethralis]SUA59362.1 PGL/p-HBAD biosynthesis glycosyltransferase Rv2957/MT3031 [Oligella urethralis]
MNQYGFTVLTPTYNRADTLPRVYESLKAQDFGDFEWLVIDDGSTDHTADLVLAWANEGIIPIRYAWQPNQHKKTAFNHGVSIAQGELIVALDSDDTLLPNALSSMWETWHRIPAIKRAGFIAVTGLCQRPDGSIVGDKFFRDEVDMSSIDMYFKHHPRGEKFGCLNTEILRCFPFPEAYDGFVPESIVWREIARAGYLTRFVNDVYRVYYDSGDSLSRQGASNASQHALGLLLLAHDTVEKSIAWFFKNPLEFFKAAVRYTRFRLHLKAKGIARPEATRLRNPAACVLVALGYPLGLALFLRDKALP